MGGIIHSALFCIPFSPATLIETYEYDYLGNRTAKTSGGVRTEYTTDLSTGYSQVLKATNGSDSVYYTRGFELISKRVESDASYYIYDGSLSVRALTNETGTITDTLVFDAFGNETTKAGTTDNSYGFQGEEKDETGLYYLRARYMDPSTGIFTSMDTYGGSLSDPMSLHKYLFANANPVKHCDPSGHFSLVETFCSSVISSTILEAGCGLLSYAIEWFCKPDDQKDRGWDLVTNLVTAIGDGIVRGFISGLFMGALKVLSIFSLPVYAFFLLLSLVSIIDSLAELGEGIDALLDDDPNNDAKAFAKTGTGAVKLYFGARDLYQDSRDIFNARANKNSASPRGGNSNSPSWPDNSGPTTPPVSSPAAVVTPLSSGDTSTTKVYAPIFMPDAEAA